MLLKGLICPLEKYTQNQDLVECLSKTEEQSVFGKTQHQQRLCSENLSKELKYERENNAANAANAASRGSSQDASSSFMSNMVAKELQRLLGRVKGGTTPPAGTPPPGTSIVPGDALPPPPVGGFADGSNWYAMMTKEAAAKEKAQQEAVRKARANDHLIRQLPKDAGMVNLPALKMLPPVVQQAASLPELHQEEEESEPSDAEDTEDVETALQIVK